MASIFVNQEFIPGDMEGFAVWRSQHYYEHLQFNLIARNIPNPVILPEYDIYSWDNDPKFAKLWLDGHYEIHQALRQLSGVSGIDLQNVDFTNQEQVFIWLESHSQEHILLEEAFGIITP